MGKTKKETWVKTRGKNVHFTPSELGQIKQMFIEGKSISQTAEAMASSCRTIGKHFKDFRDAGLAAKPTHAPANYTARLYKPNWEI